MERFRAPPITILATSAARDAPNADTLLSPIRDMFGDKAIKVVSGDEEGYLAAFGVISSINNVNGIVADQGGGSLQLTYCKKNQIEYSFSKPLGIFSLATRCEGNIHNAQNVLKQQLGNTSWLKKKQPTRALFGWGNLANISSAPNQQNRTSPECYSSLLSTH